MDTTTQVATQHTDAPSSSEQTHSRRGFACMDPAVVRELARKGGRSAHQRGVAHEFTSEEARIAGRKGGLAVHNKREVAA